MLKVCSVTDMPVYPQALSKHLYASNMGVGACSSLPSTSQKDAFSHWISSLNLVIMLKQLSNKSLQFKILTKLEYIH
jgi:hypothetical protein